MSTPAVVGGAFLEEGEETYADATCPIAMFDPRPSSQTQETENNNEPEPVENDQGFSKNTVKALLRSHS
jgi:cohesin complex subunit SCC1